MALAKCSCATVAAPLVEILERPPMTRAFTAAQITRAIRGARKDNPNAVVEFVTPSGMIRVLPSEPPPPPKQNPFDLLDLQ